MEDNIRLCNHCNNVTSHQLIADGYSNKIIGEISIGGKKEKTRADFTYFFMKCNTCEEHSLLGGFNDQLSNKKFADVPVLFPNSNILDSSVPQNIRRVYEEAAKIRNKAPNAFAGQIRRAIEFLCIDKKAKGDNLTSQLNSLVEMSIIPVTLSEMTTIIRLLGNIGAHAKEEEIDTWDAQTIDEFFRFIIEYVYVAPAKLNRVRRQLDKRELKIKYGDLFDRILELIYKEDPSGINDDYEHKYGDGYGLEFFYEDEAIFITKKLKDLHSDEELESYIFEELNILVTDDIERIVNGIWILWNLYKKK